MHFWASQRGIHVIRIGHQEDVYSEYYEGSSCMAMYHCVCDQIQSHTVSRVKIEPRTSRLGECDHCA
jgi:hypothetical protein